MADIQSREEADRIHEEFEQEFAALCKPPDYEEFERGVQLAKKYMKHLSYLYGTPPEFFFGRIPVTTLTVGFVDSVIITSENSRLAYDYLLLLASNLLRDNEPLPANFSKWLGEVVGDMLRTEKKRPPPKKPRGPYEYTKYVRDTAIEHTIRLLVRSGWTAVGDQSQIDNNKKETGKEWADSAVFAVAKAENMTYDAVKKIWANRTGNF